MIIGSGLLAQGFSKYFAEQSNIWVYAAGVSNSACTNKNEFLRERSLLMDALEQADSMDTFLYFSTCSIYDPGVFHSPYVQHKLAMEKLASKHERFFIFRLPQIAGHTPNPHTLLNYLYARIIRSESFSVWKNAKRNIIDIDDVVAVVREIVRDESNYNMIFNVANTDNYSIMNIVESIESIVSKKAVYEISERGEEYAIDVHKTIQWFESAGMSFDDQYLSRTIRKYYGKK